MRVVGVTVVAALLVGAVAGCSAGADAPDSAATPSVTVPASPSASPSASGKGPLTVSEVGPQGLDVRYLDKDGKVRELKVEDFPR